MTVSKLVVLFSVNFSFDPVWKVCYFPQIPEQFFIRVITSVLKSIFAQ